MAYAAELAREEMLFAEPEIRANLCTTRAV
jgi:hypothetical protein